MHKLTTKQRNQLAREATQLHLIRQKLDGIRGRIETGMPEAFAQNSPGLTAAIGHIEDAIAGAELGWQDLEDAAAE